MTTQGKGRRFEPWVYMDAFNVKCYPLRRKISTRPSGGVKITFSDEFWRVSVEVLARFPELSVNIFSNVTVRVRARRGRKCISVLRLRLTIFVPASAPRTAIKGTLKKEGKPEDIATDENGGQKKLRAPSLNSRERLAAPVLLGADCRAQTIREGADSQGHE